MPYHENEKEINPLLLALIREEPSKDSSEKIQKLMQDNANVNPTIDNSSGFCAAIQFAINNLFQEHEAKKNPEEIDAFYTILLLFLKPIMGSQPSPMRPSYITHNLYYYKGAYSHFDQILISSIMADTNFLTFKEKNYPNAKYGNEAIIQEYLCEFKIDNQKISEIVDALVMCVACHILDKILFYVGHYEMENNTRKKIGYDCLTPAVQDQIKNYLCRETNETDYSLIIKNIRKIVASSESHNVNFRQDGISVIPENTFIERLCTDSVKAAINEALALRKLVLTKEGKFFFAYDLIRGKLCPQDNISDGSWGLEDLDEKLIRAIANSSNNTDNLSVYERMLQKAFPFFAEAIRSLNLAGYKLTFPNNPSQLSTLKDCAAKTLLMNCDIANLTEQPTHDLSPEPVSLENDPAQASAWGADLVMATCSAKNSVIGSGSDLFKAAAAANSKYEDFPESPSWSRSSSPTP